MACAHAAATIMPVHTVAQKSPVAYTPAADEPAAAGEEPPAVGEELPTLDLDSAPRVSV